MKGRNKVPLGLLALAAALWLASIEFFSVGFILKLGALASVAGAGLIWLTGPFESPGAKRWSRALLTAAAVLALGLLISFIWIEGLIFGGRDGRPSDDAGVLVVLGAGLNGSRPSLVLQSRLDVACEYMTAHPDCVAVLTGSRGPNESVTEASAMAEYLMDKGIEEGRLYLEEEAHNTAQNIKYSVALMAREGLEGEIMVVSSEFHLYRAERIFRRFDVEAYSLPAPAPRVGLVPLNSYVREYCSIVVMGIKEILNIDE